MTTTLIISVCTVVLMILSVLFLPIVRIGRVQVGGYCLAALLGAFMLLVTGCVSPQTAINGIFASSSINPVKILVLFLSMTSFSILLDELGFFRYLATATLHKAGRQQKVLFTYLYVIVSALTVFTSNDIIILTFTPFICSFAFRAKISPVPYLFAEFVAANTWSMALMIGNPTNIYIASFENIGFFEYIGVMLFPTLAGGVVSLGVLYLLFRKTLAKPIEASAERSYLDDPVLVKIGLAHLIVCIVLLTVSSYIGFEMWLVSLVLAVSLFVISFLYRTVHRESRAIILHTAMRMPWELVPFVLSMFVLVLSLDENGVCSAISGLLGTKNAVWTYGSTSFVSANLLNNIPMSVLFAELSDVIEEPASRQAAYASIVGSNLGAYLTPIGALAGIMWSGILRRHGVKFDFRDFVRYGAAVSLPTLAATLAVLDVVL